jgi:hypothetical protein
MDTPMTAPRLSPTRLRPGHLLAAALLALTLGLPPGAARAEDSAPAAASDDPRTAYRPLDLAQAVPKLRMTDGTRAVFAPQAVRFTARLAQLPAPQKAEYLKQVMGMMGMTADLKVSHRIVIDYGGDKPLAAYVEDDAATRIGKELKTGDTRIFYAFHVYNNRYGPALVVTSFEEAEHAQK